MADVNTRAFAVPAFIRAADAMLRALGGTSVILRIAVTGGPATGLGTAPPLTEDIALAPAAVRALPDAGRVEVLLSASALRHAAQKRGLASADELLAVTLRLLHAGSEMVLDEISSETFAGVPYLYRISARE